VPDYYYPPHETVECTYTVTVAPPPADSAEARLARAKGDLEHRFAERLRIRVAEAELRHEEADAELAAQELAEARLRLERMTVRAPCNGIVLTRDGQHYVVSYTYRGRALVGFWSAETLQRHQREDDRGNRPDHAAGEVIHAHHG